MNTLMEALGTHNRVLNAILVQQKRIAGMNGIGLNGGSLTDLDRKLSDLSTAEIYRYNQVRAEAQARGTLTYEESNTVWICLGPDGWTADADLAAKIVVLHLMGELMGGNAGPPRREPV